VALVLPVPGRKPASLYPARRVAEGAGSRHFGCDPLGWEWDDDGWQGGDLRLPFSPMQRRRQRSRYILSRSRLRAPGRDRSEAPRRLAPSRRRRRMRSRIDPCFDQLPPPHERHPGQRNSVFFQFKRARCSWATGITARGIGRVKNVTTGATRLIAPCFQGTMVGKEDSKISDHTFGTGGSVECENCSVILEVSRTSSSI
jgi:hypothetical protein